MTPQSSLSNSQLLSAQHGRKHFSFRQNKLTFFGPTIDSSTVINAKHIQIFSNETFRRNKMTWAMMQEKPLSTMHADSYTELCESCGRMWFVGLGSKNRTAARRL